MTTPPLPDVPCVRCHMIWEDALSNKLGTRFFLSYSGSAPTGANCATLASDIEGAWAAHIQGLVVADTTLVEIDVIDIATYSGLSGQWTGADAGTLSGTSLPIQVAFDVEYGIGRRYRGGKPRGYWPFGGESQRQDQANWTSGFVTSVDTDITAFFAAVNALSVGAMGTLHHVNLSYYHSFSNHDNTSGRARPVPTYKATATHDNVTGYIPKQMFSSQRRRRQSTTP